MSDLAKVDEEVAEEAGAAHHEDDGEAEVQEEPRQQQPGVPARGADHQQHAAAGHTVKQTICTDYAQKLWLHL